MPVDPKRGFGPIGVVVVLWLVVGVTVALLEQVAQGLLAKQAAAGGTLPHHYEAVGKLLQAYLAARAHVLRYWFFYIPGVLFGPALFLVMLKKLAAGANRWREELAGMRFRQERYDLEPVRFSLRELIRDNQEKQEQRVVLGMTPKHEPVFLTDLDRSMHVHVLGQTGSGKTKSVIEPLLFQDLRRGRGVLVVDAKASQENEERLAGMAHVAGRLSEVKTFTLNPNRPTHTYNPLHVRSGADDNEVKAIAERVFSTFADDMDNPYYKDQSRMFFVALVRALAGTGKAFSMLDVAAAIASRDVLAAGLEQSANVEARRLLEAQIAQLGRNANETFTGLLAAVRRYDLPSVNAYDPDIVLEEEIERGGIVAFYLPTNYYKQLARYIGLCVFQHVQQVGALRQLDRSRSQRPLYVYTDEFYSFAYEGFTEAVNKLRDAHISILLAHQTMSDLDKVSPEFAKGILDNTRNKIVLYQNDFEVCERLAKSLGTAKGVEYTVRRSVDGFLNSVSTLEASSREVDAYCLHPNRIKSLRCGQAYLLKYGQQGEETFVGVNLQQIPALPVVVPPVPKRPVVAGIGLHDLFLSMPVRAAVGRAR